MGKRDKKINEIYGGSVRLRVAGILIEEDRVVLVNHKGLNSDNEFWAPPGGGVRFGESLKEAVIREFHEETGLAVTPGKLITLTEYIDPPLHAVELFFLIEKSTGSMRIGSDPEMNSEDQIIKNVKFFDIKKLTTIPNLHKHKLLHGLKEIADLNASKMI